ncbi:MAG: hypothetical protein AAGA26_06800 [Pseudomonadota bacterium]
MIRILALLILAAVPANATEVLNPYAGIEKGLFQERVLSEEIAGGLIRQHRTGCDRGRIVRQTQGITAGSIWLNRYHNQFLHRHVDRINRRVQEQCL